MPSLLALMLASLATPLALLLSLTGQSERAMHVPVLALTGEGTGHKPVKENDRSHGVMWRAPQYPAEPASSVTPLDAFRGGQVQRQIRIEQRVIVRISPQRDRDRSELLAQLPQRALNTRFEERKTNKCIELGGISGVQTGSGNRLLLFMRDHRILTVNLEKACRARDFYSGFYVEKNKDGKMCIDRDKLLSRNGAKCEVERMRQLVAIED